MPPPASTPPVPDAAGEHQIAVLVSNELLRELCAGDLRAEDVPARAVDLAANPEACRPRPDAASEGEPADDRIQA